MDTVIVDRREMGARWLDGAERPWLLPLSALYALGQAIDRRIRPRRPLPAQPPSLTIGNLRVGGSGKTPVVADLGARLRADGIKVAVISRGYRADGGGDEPEWLRSHGLDVELNAHRRDAFAAVKERGADFVLLDDALQSTARARWSAAIVLDTDLRRQPALLPAGPAREGFGALRRVDFLFVRCEGDGWPPSASIRPPQLPKRASAHAFRLWPVELQPLCSDAQLPGRVGLLSGLARPESFERDACAFGVRPIVSLRFSDHAQPTPEVLLEIDRCVAEYELDGFVLPQKNASRFAKPLNARGLAVHQLRSRIEWAEDPLPRLRALLSGALPIN